MLAEIASFFKGYRFPVCSVIPWDILKAILIAVRLNFDRRAFFMCL